MFIEGTAVWILSELFSFKKIDIPQEVLQYLCLAPQASIFFITSFVFKKEVFHSYSAVFTFTETFHPFYFILYKIGLF